MTMVMTVIPAEGAILDDVLDAMCQTVHGGLNRQAYGKFHTARKKMTWGSRGQRLFALVEGLDVLASAAQYDLTGVFEGRPTRVYGISSVCAESSQRDFGHARVLIDTLLDNAARDGAEMALLFSHTGVREGAGHGFQTIPLMELTLSVTESSRRGAPMTMVRGGEERDLAAIVAMGRVRAEPFRFHLDRDIDFVQYVITTKRLLAGLGSAHARQLHFFIAEEGITAAAYVIVSVAGNTWTLEECGDRDSSGARVGALLQALIAREPVERRPTIHAWLPPGFLPPQVTIASATPSKEVINVCLLGSRTSMPPLSSDDVLYWHNDLI
jgi:hypothetical protein